MGEYSLKVSLTISSDELVGGGSLLISDIRKPHHS